MNQYQVVLSHMRSGKSDREIARMGLMGRGKCAQMRAVAVAQGWLDGGPPEPQAVHAALLGDAASNKAKLASVSAVEVHREQVLAWVSEGVNAMTIFAALKRLGFAGSYSAVRRFVSKLPKSIKATMPLDFAPGESAQVDFGSGPTLLEKGRRIKTWVFVMVLSFSRLLYAELVRDQTVATWLACHRRAFEFFGGIARSIRIDNCKCAITLACATSPVVQRSYGEFAMSLGFKIDPCLPGRPEHKGRVERGVGYVKKSFFPTRVIESIVEGNQALLHWCRTEAGERIHGSTQERPNARFEAERHLLLSLPQRWPELCSYTTAKVHRDCHIQVAGALYSVPWEYIGQTLTVKLGERLVEVYGPDHQIVAAHLIAAKGTRRMDLQHFPEAARAFFAKDRKHLQKVANNIGTRCAALIEQLLGDRIVDRLRAAQGVLRLADRYGAKALEAACTRALAFGFDDYKTVKTILQNGTDGEQLQLDLEVSNPVYRGQSRFAPTQH